jgi:hypothetical protein
VIIASQFLVSTQVADFKRKSLPVQILDGLCYTIVDESLLILVDSIFPELNIVTMEAFSKSVVWKF